MSFMREKVETQIKPMAEMARAGMVPHGRLLAGGLDIVADFYDETFKVIDERNKKLCWYEFCLTPELFLAMGIHPFLGESHPSMMSFAQPDVCWKYVDAAENQGVPTELCVLDKFMYGALVCDEMPAADFIVTASAPCDSSRIGYQMYEQLTGLPVYRLDAPAEDTPEAHKYYAGEIHKLIGFLEEQSGTRFDIDRLREVCEESNRATETLGEILELRRARPCPQAGVVSFGCYMAATNSFGIPELTSYLEFLRDDAIAMVKQGKGALSEEKHRVLWYYTPVVYDFELQEWLGNTLGAISVLDVLSGYLRQEPIDTKDLDTMLLALAQRGLESTMSRIRVRSTTLTERFLRDYADFTADCVIFPGPVGCKHVWGWLSLLREVCKQKGIPICAFDLDWMDSRVRSSDSVRSQIEEFFATVMN